MKYKTASEACSHCKKQVSLFSKNVIRFDQKYSFVCPYCKKENSLKGSIGIEKESLPLDAVEIKPV